MCGLTGFLATETASAEIGVYARRMVNTLAHRGPDDAGVWVDEDAGVALAHRRLSILDLSAGHQPMLRQRRFVITYNGEIYNHLELRHALEKKGSAPAWRGHSDTETLLAAIEAWGIEKTVKAIVGMFAFAVWDRKMRILTIARDRLGEKPLYYGWVRGALVFASELKAIRAYPGFDNPIERRALALFMRFNCVPTPWSIYSDIWKLSPGCLVRFRADALSAGDRGEKNTYWSARTAAELGLIEPFGGNDQEAQEELDRLRDGASPVKWWPTYLGALLSGGIDSSCCCVYANRVQPSGEDLHHRLPRRI